MTVSQSQRLATALASLRDRAGADFDTAIILGSGLGHLADRVSGAVAIPYGEIDGFPVSTAPSHAGRLVLGELFGGKVALMQGRFHLYEGWAPQDIALAVYVLKGLGAKRLVVTNAAGALNPDYGPGEAMVITDHLNFTGVNPLTGPNDETIGPRFPDMSRAYDPALLSATVDAARDAGVPLHAGIYAGVAGPSLETSAERRYFRAAGGDAVGMSTVHEVIAAAHVGLPVLGLSAITNKATGGPDQQPDTVEEVLANAEISGRKIAAILETLLRRLDA
jgi:purine-nucleoside phosphorylase